MSQYPTYPRLVALGRRVDGGDYPLCELMVHDGGARPSRPACLCALGVTPEEHAYLTEVLTPYMAADEMAWQIEPEADGFYAGKSTWYAFGYWATTVVELSRIIISCYYHYR